MKPVNNDTAGKGYCGPTAVAVITGKKLSTVLDAYRVKRYGKTWRSDLRREYGYRYTPPIKGTQHNETLAVLRQFGWEVDKQEAFGWNTKERPTLAQWVKTRGFDNGDRKQPWLVSAGHHWQVVKGNRYADTYTGGQPVPLKQSPHRRAKVANAYRLTRLKKQA